MSMEQRIGLFVTAPLTQSTLQFHLFQTLLLGVLSTGTFAMPTASTTAQNYLISLLWQQGECFRHLSQFALMKGGKKT